MNHSLKQSANLILLSILFILISCSANKPAHKNQSDAGMVKTIDSLNLIALQKGTDFQANGMKPVSWKLDMDFDSHFFFTNINGMVIKANPVMEIAADPSVEIYNTSYNGKMLHISIFHEPCNNQNVKHQRAVKTVVYHDGISYEGCGEFLTDERLQQKWTLEFIDNEQQFPINYANGMPFLNFDLAGSRLTGFDGKVKISCNITVKGNRIDFGKIVADRSTNRYTISALIDEFMSNRLVEYYFRDDKLVLQLINDTRLVFRKN